MKINKAQKIQLKIWLKMRDVEKVTFKVFLSSQPKIWWYIIIFLMCFWLVLELTNQSSFIVRAVNVAGIVFNFILFTRSKLYWPISRQCIDWEKVENLLDSNED